MSARRARQISEGEVAPDSEEERQRRFMSYRTPQFTLSRTRNLRVIEILSSSDDEPAPGGSNARNTPGNEGICISTNAVALPESSALSTVASRNLVDSSSDDDRQPSIQPVYRPRIPQMPRARRIIRSPSEESSSSEGDNPSVPATQSRASAAQPTTSRAQVEVIDLTQSDDDEREHFISSRPLPNSVPRRLVGFRNSGSVTMNFAETPEESPYGTAETPEEHPYLDSDVENEEGNEVYESTENDSGAILTRARKLIPANAPASSSRAGGSTSTAHKRPDTMRPRDPNPEPKSDSDEPLSARVNVPGPSSQAGSTSFAPRRPDMLSHRDPEPESDSDEPLSARVNMPGPSSRAAGNTSTVYKRRDMLSPREPDPESDSDSAANARAKQKSVPVSIKAGRASRMTKKALAAAEKTKREAYARSLFDELNRKVFGGAFSPETPLNWSNRLRTTAGRAHWRRSKDGVQSYGIELATKVLDCNERINYTLSHEMCHLACWVINEDPKAGHGPLFYGWAQRVMRARPDIKVTTKHSYEINYKYEWKCEKCDKIYGRHSKSIDPDQCVCGLCKVGKLIPQFKTSKRTEKASKQLASQGSSTTVPLLVDNSGDSDVEILAHVLGEVQLTTT